MEANHFWFGKGAELLGLQGEVDFKIFEGLLKGRFPDGTLMTQLARDEYHRPGYDLTFSAPKSVSILALVADNQEVLVAFRQSVQEVLSKIEQKYGSCRNRNQGDIEIEKTKNMVFAVFEEGDSRAGGSCVASPLCFNEYDSTCRWRMAYPVCR